MRAPVIRVVNLYRYKYTDNIVSAAGSKTCKNLPQGTQESGDISLRKDGYYITQMEEV